MTHAAIDIHTHILPKQGATPLVMNPAEFEQYPVGDIAKWRKVITDAGIKLD